MQTMNLPDRAGRGGAFHALSGNVYEGGQFMPEPDKLGKARRSAAKKAGELSYNSVEVIETQGRFLVVAQVRVRFVPSAYEPRWITRPVTVAAFQSEADASAVASSIPAFRS